MNKCHWNILNKKQQKAYYSIAASFIERWSCSKLMVGDKTKLIKSNFQNWKRWMETEAMTEMNKCCCRSKIRIVSLTYFHYLGFAICHAFLSSKPHLYAPGPWRHSLIGAFKVDSLSLLCCLQQFFIQFVLSNIDK